MGISPQGPQTTGGTDPSSEMIIEGTPLFEHPSLVQVAKNSVIMTTLQSIRFQKLC
jgi:hypothetical protein